MPKYIFLSGSGGTGKTTTMKRLWEKWASEDNIVKGWPANRKNANAILRYKGKKIGFHSWGDTLDAYTWDGGLEELENRRCSIIITACRPSGQTSQYLLKQYYGCDVFWIAKYQDAELEKSAKRTVKHLVLLIDGLIGA